MPTETASARPMLAVIPARGGSKGLPGKNIRPLGGLPLIAHSIRLAKMCPEIDRCIVSTDSEDIAAVAREHGGEVPFVRPADLARDDTPMMPVVQHALRTVEETLGRRFASVLLLDPTSPGRLPEDVREASTLLSEVDVDGVIACSRPTFNPFWVGVVEKNQRMARAFESDVQYTRRQDVPPFWRINGSLYLWRREALLPDVKPWFNGRHRLLEIPESRAFSIDTEYEFSLAEALIEKSLLRLPWLSSSRT